MKTKTITNKLTVIFRDDAPLICASDTPTYRRVTLKLTEDQIEQLAVKNTCKSMKNDIYESISECFLEIDE